MEPVQSARSAAVRREDDQISILIVEDEAIIALHLQHLLENFGYRVLASASSGREAIDKAERYAPDLILMDISLEGDMDGIQAATRILESRPTPVIYMTSYADPRTFQRAKGTDPFGYILKPVDEQELYTALELALLRQRKEKSLIKAEDWYPLAGRIYMDGFWHWNALTDELFFSPRSRSVLGIETDDGPQSLRDFIALVHPEDRANFERDLQEHLNGASPFLDVIHRIQVDQDNVRWIHSMAIAVRDAQGRAQLLTGSLGDITGRKKTEQSLDESRRFIQGIMEAMPAVLYIYDLLDAKPYYINRQAQEILGARADRFMESGGSEFRRVFHFDRPAQERLALFRGETGASIADTEIRIEREDGDSRWLSLREIVYSRNEFGAPQQILGTAYDITGRKQAELALIQEKEWQTVTLGSISDGVLTTDRRGDIISINRVARNLLGVEEDAALGQPISQLCRFIDERSHEALADPIERTLQTGERVEHYRPATLANRESGEPFISFTANPLHNERAEIIGAVLVLRDVTEQLRTERELRKMQALDSLGILAGGIAHDFNNILTAIQNNISLAALSAEDPSALRLRLGEAEKACIRARGLTHQLLTFARGGSPIKKTTSIPELVVETADFVLRGSRVSAVYEIAEDLWPADVDETQISHVINNLALNAMQAMTDGGRIYVSLSNLDQNRAAARDPLLERDHYVKLSVRDEGPGISREHLDHIFDPYFTTKKMGSGLGLSSAYSIIKKHDGHIRASSAPGHGALFEIYLPARPGAAVSPREARDEPVRGVGRILLMDDEEDIRDTLAQILNRLGYEVATADDGESAVELYRQACAKGPEFDVVILDLTVPGGMGGLQAANEMRRAGGKARFVVSSGYSNDPVIADFPSYGFDGGLAKPFLIKDLSRLIRQLIDAPVS